LVRVVDADTGTPIQGAFVTLLDASGNQRTSALSNDAGRTLFVGISPGLYAARAEMIGRESAESEPFPVADETPPEVVVQLSYQPFEMEEIRIESEARCVVRPGEGAQTARVWEEARKALEIQEWSDEADLFRFQVVNYERDLDAEARRVERETRRVEGGVSANPIRSLPAGNLLEKGFIRPEEGGGWEYWAPDAGVLLSDEFLDTHCFRLRSDEDEPSLVGLAFEPVSVSDVADIEGALWLDRESAALQSLDFSYIWEEYAEARGVSRGRVEFERIPNGAWIVRNWWIQMPLLARDPGRARGGRSDVFLSGIRESGARVSRIETLSRDRVDHVETGSVQGVVWDSTRSKPLEGAEVFLSGTSHATESDPEGRFYLNEVPVGNYPAAFTHPRLDALGVFGQSVEVEVSPNSQAVVDLGVPGLETVLHAVCPSEERLEGPGFLAGMVRHAHSGVPVSGVAINLRWQEQQPRVREMRLETRTDDRGRYLACGLPEDGLLAIEVSHLDWERTDATIRIPEGPYPVVGFVISPTESRVDVDPADLAALEPAVTPRDPGRISVQEAPAELPDEIGSVTGVVLDLDSSEPLSDVAVSLGEPTLTQLTNERGAFMFPVVEPGIYSLKAELLGRASVEDSLQVEADKIQRVTVRMPFEALPVEGILVEVEARQVELEVAGFYERQRETSGLFISREEIEEQAPRHTTDLFRALPGVRVVTGLGMGTQNAVTLMGIRETFSSSYDSPCYPAVWIDGQMVHQGGAGPLSQGPAWLDQLIHPDDIAGIEVYKSAASLPVRYNLFGECGVIVIWTR
jgi:hypothetical protein